MPTGIGSPSPNTSHKTSVDPSMAIASLIPGRVPLSLSSSRLSRVIADSQTRLSQLQDQISSGHRFSLPSEAPTAATQTIVLQKLDERRTGFQQVAKTTQGFLSATDTALATIGDSLNQARSIAAAGIGDQVSPSEREGLASEVGGLIQSVLQAGNVTFNGRYLFAGSATDRPPFEQLSTGVIRYNGDGLAQSNFVDFGLEVGSAVNGADLQAFSAPITGDLNPTLTLSTRISQLHGGSGLHLGIVNINLNNGAASVRKSVDLSSADTIQDVKTQLEAAFAGEPLTLDVAIDPSNFGLQLTPSAGTVEVLDTNGGRTAADLGIRSGPAAVVHGADLDPALALSTTVASLNGGTGIGATAGTGLLIQLNGQSHVVDLNGAVTVQDLLNRIRDADANLAVGISADGSGLSISSRLSGANFSIGENGGNNASLLKLRTFTASTKLSDLNYGVGVLQRDVTPFKITRRDGTAVSIDLKSAGSVQDVLDAINAVDPGHLVAALNTVGNGISLTDDSGSNPLVVTENAVSTALGINGAEATGAAGVLSGRDVNPQQPTGVLNLLASLQKALTTDDRATLTRLTPQIDAEANRTSVVRADVGSRQKFLDDVTNRLDDAHVQVQDQLSQLYDVDFSAAVTSFLQQQQALQGALQVASQALQLSILKYL